MCNAKIRPFPDDTELQCERDHFGSGREHRSTLRDYAFPGSATTITWMEDDRRNFRGDWMPCPADCTLPAAHHGDHAP